MEGRASGSDFRDWAYLPLPTVLLVSENIKSLTDYVRFRAVCSPWRSATPSKPYKPVPPQLPWLMLPYAPHQEQIYVFYDLWEAKFRRVYIPETVGRWCCATYRGWLLLVAGKGSELFLFNPVTRARVDLPSSKGGFAITKVTFSSDLTDPGCVVMVFLAVFQRILYCRVGDRCWTMVSRPPVPHDERADAAYHNGAFYLLTTGSMHICYLNRSKAPKEFLFGGELLGDVEKFFLVGKSDGLYMVAVRYTEEEEEEGSKHVIKMYQIPDDGMGEFKRVIDTNDTAIFYADKNHHYLAVCADDWDMLEGSSIYMQYRCAPADAKVPALKQYSILFTKLEDGKPKPVLLNFGEEPKIWPPPSAMWFQPSFD